MQLSMIQKACRWGLVAALTCAAAMANAAVVVVRWDPEFNTTFSGIVGTQVGWQGEAFISVADNCLTPAGTSLVGGSACSSAVLEQGTLRFFDMAPGGSDLLNLSWDKDDTGFDANVWAVRTNGTDVTGIISFPAIEFDNKFLVDRFVDIDLYFVFNPFSLSDYSGPLLAMSYDQCNGYGYHRCQEKTFLSGTSTDPNDPTAPKVTFSRVPEPGSLALFGLALVAGGWARRRFEVRRPTA